MLLDGAYGITDLDGMLEMRIVIQKAAFNRVRKVLESDVRSIMPYSEYVTICAENGVPSSEAGPLLRNLHSCGVIFHFHQSKMRALHDVIFLKPEEVTDSMFSKLDLETPTESWVAEQVRCIHDFDVYDEYFITTNA